MMPPGEEMNPLLGRWKLVDLERGEIEARDEPDALGEPAVAVGTHDERTRCRLDRIRGVFGHRARWRDARDLLALVSASHMLPSGPVTQAAARGAVAVGYRDRSQQRPGVGDATEPGGAVAGGVPGVAVRADADAGRKVGARRRRTERCDADGVGCDDAADPVSGRVDEREPEVAVGARG